MSNENLEQETQEVDLTELDSDVKRALQEEVPEEANTEQYSEAEQRAMAIGWSPDPESLKDSGKEWIPAEEFLRNQTFFNEIKHLKKELKKQQKVTEAFKEQNKIVQEKAYERAYDTLRQQKIKAAEDNDLTEMLKADERMKQLAQTKDRNKQEESAAGIKQRWDDAYEDFLDNNSWYSDDPVQAAFADKVGQQLFQQNPQSDPNELYEAVAKKVKEKFTKAEEATAKESVKQKASTVAAPTRSGTRVSKKTMADVPEDHRRIAMTLIKSGEMSEADYLKQYFAE